MLVLPRVKLIVNPNLHCVHLEREFAGLVCFHFLPLQLTCSVTYFPKIYNVFRKVAYSKRVLVSFCKNTPFCTVFSTVIVRLPVMHDCRDYNISCFWLGSQLGG